MTPNVVSTADLIGGWLADLESGEPPEKYALPSPFGPVDLRPGMVAVFAGQPGAGKTAAMLQITVELLRMNPAARALIANVEMAPVRLLERIVSRLSGVPLTCLRDRTLTDDQTRRVHVGVNTLRQVGDRLTFLREPYTLEHVALSADQVQAKVLIVDYVQRFTLTGEKADERAGLNANMDMLRTFGHGGALVLAVSALARGNSPNGSTYANPGMASLRGSSELEYGADAVYILQPAADGPGVTLANPKQRDGAPADVALTFDGAVQAFSPAEDFDALAAFDVTAPAKRRGA